MPLLDSIPRIRGPVGRPRHRPRQLFADRGHDYDKYRRLLRARCTTPKIARKGTAHGTGLGKTRRAVEHTFAWLHQLKRLRIRYETDRPPSPNQTIATSSKKASHRPTLLAPSPLAAKKNLYIGTFYSRGLITQPGA